MAVLPHTHEELSSQIPALRLLMAMGYEYSSPARALDLRGNSTNEVVLLPILVEELKKRRFTHRGKEYPLSSNSISEIVRKLASPSLNDGLLRTNESLYDSLTLGITVTEFVDGAQVKPTIPIIDWRNLTDPGANQFHVTDEYAVLKADGIEHRRPDIVCFVNGLPLVVIEAKRPDPHSPKVDLIKEGISQSLRNQGVHEIPHLFAYSQLLLSIDGKTGRYGTTSTPMKFWGKWREEEIPDDAIAALKNTRLADSQKAELFDSRPNQVRAYFDELDGQGQLLPTDQDRILVGLLRKDRLLEFVRFFILFDKKVGKVAARYQQVFGIKALLARISENDVSGARQGGVVWHTTGSGKSFTMAFLAMALILDDSLKQCRVIVVTDRVDLEDQLSKTFASSGALAGKRAKQRAMATSGRDLADRIGKGNDRIVFSIVNKFHTASKLPECHNESSDIIVLVDEGHRSHGGETHERMRRALPNAAYVAFTGTPLLKGEKTTNKFGPIIHAYTMQRAEEDGAVTPLLYEQRVPELAVNSRAIDNWFDRITEGLTDAERADLKKKFAKKEAVYNSESRIELIAHDIADHFVKNIDDGLKGQLATKNKESAILYKRYLDDTDLVTSAIVMSPPDTREGHTEVDEKKSPVVQEWWEENVGKQGESEYTKEIKRQFAEEGEPQILIVVDKLLTGFDEPRNAVLYIDKPLKDHSILQAVARVNRLHEKKKFGLLIDYRGILEELDVTMRKYQDLANRTQAGYDIEDLDGLFGQISTEYKRLPMLHDKLWAVFSGVANRADLEQYRQVLIPLYETDKDDHSYDKRQKVRDDFYDALTEFGLCLKVALSSASFFEDASFPDDLVDKYKRDLRFFSDLRKIAKQDSQEAVDYSEYEDRIKKLIDKHVVGEAVREPAGVYLVGELGKEDPKEWSEEKTRNETDIIRTRVTKTIEQKLRDDPYAQKVFSELLQAAIAEAESLFDHPLKQYALFKRFEEKLESRELDDIPPSLADNSHARAYYGVFRLVLGDERFRDMEKAAHQEVCEHSLLIDDVVTKAVAEHSINPQNIDAQIRKDLLPCLFKLGIGMDKVKAVIEEVIRITRIGISQEKRG